jgi:hypothetical protein
MTHHNATGSDAVDLDKARTAFEAWARQAVLPLRRADESRNGIYRDMYYEEETCAAWIAWQAALIVQARAAAPAHIEYDRIVKADERAMRAADALDGMAFTYDEKIGWLPSKCAAAPAPQAQAAADTLIAQIQALRPDVPDDVNIGPQGVLYRRGYRGAISDVLALVAALAAKDEAPAGEVVTIKMTNTKTGATADWNVPQASVDAAEAKCAAILATQQADAKPAAWIDQFGNVWPLAAYSPTGKPSYLDAHKRGWEPLFRAAPVSERAEDARDYPAVQLTRDTVGMCVVSLEIGGKWVPVIKDNGDIIGHIVEPLGIRLAIERAATNATKEGA